MISALNIAATGMNVSVDQINTTAFNLSNLQTTGFKNLMLVTADLKYQTRSPAGIAKQDGAELSPVGVQFGSGAKTAAVFRIIKQGDLKPTGNPLHLAISGSGYFKVDAGNGRYYYTRNGSFTKNKDGLIVTAEGYAVEPKITIPEDIIISDAKQFFIDEDGTVKVRNNKDQSAAFEPVGQILLHNFPNEAGLTAVGGSYFEENPDASGVASAGNFRQNPSFGNILQGNLEQSTVDAVEDLTNAIAAQRAYELNSKMIKIADEMLSSANQIK